MLLKDFYRECNKWVVRFEHRGEELETMDECLGIAITMAWRML